MKRSLNQFLNLLSMGKKENPITSKNSINLNWNKYLKKSAINLLN